MKTNPTAPPALASSLSLHPMRGEGRGEGSALPPARNPNPDPAPSLLGRQATHPHSAERTGIIRSVVEGYAWLEYTTENEFGQSPTLSLGHYKLTELTLL